MAYRGHVEGHLLLRAAWLGPPDDDLLQIGRVHRAARRGEAAERRGSRGEVVGPGLLDPAVDEVLPAVHDDGVAADDRHVERVLGRRLPLAIQVDLDRRRAWGSACDQERLRPCRHPAASAAPRVELHRAAGALIHAAGLREEIGDRSILSRQAVESGARDRPGDRDLLARVLGDEERHLRVAQQRLPQASPDAIPELRFGGTGCLNGADVWQADGTGRRHARSHALHLRHARHADLDQIARTETEIGAGESATLLPQSGHPCIVRHGGLRLRHGVVRHGCSGGGLRCRHAVRIGNARTRSGAGRQCEDDTQGRCAAGDALSRVHRCPSCERMHGVTVDGSTMHATRGTPLAAGGDGRAVASAQEVIR